MSPSDASKRPRDTPKRQRAQDQEGLLAQRVRERAQALGWSLTALAEAAGLSRQTLADLLRVGRAPRGRWPHVRTLLALAGMLKVHPYWLTEALCADARVSLHLSAMMQGDRAGFVEDSRVPDGCVVRPGARFVKTWTCQKLSSTDWRGCRLQRWDERVDARALTMAGAACPEPARLRCDIDSVPLEDLGEGEVFAADLVFQAPERPGLAYSYWVAVNAQGEPVFTEHAGLAVIVHVVEGDLSAQPVVLEEGSNPPLRHPVGRVYRR